MISKSKWVGLILSGGVLLQLSTCATDVGYYVLQALVNQVLTGALAGT